MESLPRDLRKTTIDRATCKQMVYREKKYTKLGRTQTNIHRDDGAKFCLIPEFPVAMLIYNLNFEKI